MDWAVHSSGRPGAFHVRDGVVESDFLFVAGDIRSTDPNDLNMSEDDFNYALTGPYTKSDPTGLGGTTIQSAIEFQQAESGAGRKEDYEISLHVINRNTGRPLDIITFPAFHHQRVQALGAATFPVAENKLTTRVSMGGRFTGNITLSETVSCTPLDNGIASVSCSDTFSSTTLDVDLKSAGFASQDILTPRARLTGFV